VHDGPSCALDGIDGAPDQFLARRRHDLDGHVVGNAVLVDELAHEVPFDLGRGGEAHLDFLEADAHQHLEHPQLALQVHGLDERLVAIAQVGGQPDGRTGDLRVGPCAVLEPDGGEGAVLAGGVLQHGCRSSIQGGGTTSNCMQKQNGPLLVHTGR
jgi:hypothetical protein